MARTKAQVEQENSILTGNLMLLEERLVELELAIEDTGWRNLNDTNMEEFSSDGIRRLIRLARLSWLKNPLIRHSVEVHQSYVFGQGWHISGHGKVDEVIQEVLTDKGNLSTLTSHEAMLARELQRETEGNIFFVLFTNESTGYTRIHTIPTEQILDGDIIRNPDDRDEVWYYKRVYDRTELNVQTGTTEHTTITEFHPDWRYEPEDKPPTIGGHDVLWDEPVYHFKTGGLPGWKFGIPSFYAAIDWAKAVTSDLEDYASLRKALSRFAWQLTTKGGKAAVTAARKRLDTTLGRASEGTEGSINEQNPAPATASTWISSEAYGLQPMRTAGATPTPEEGRRLWYMVSAGTGIPEPILAGDATLGTYATAKTLDRPTELRMKNLQKLWIDTIDDLLGYVIDQAIKAPNGLLPGTVTVDERRGGEKIEIGIDPNAEPELDADGLPKPLEPMDRTIDIDVPDILEEDIGERVGAIVSAATLDGKSPAGTMDPKTLVRLLLQALGESDSVETILEILFPSDLQPEDLVPVAPTAAPATPDTTPAPPAGPPEPNPTQLAEAIADFKKAAYRAMKIEDAELAS